MTNAPYATHKDYTIHKITDETLMDKPTLAGLVIRLLKPYDDAPDATLDAVDNAIRHGHAYLAMKEKEHVGVCIVINFRLNGFIPTHHMAFLGVDENHRRNGLAKTLFELAVEDCGGEMSLHVDLDNAAAMAFYEKQGCNRLYHRYLYGREH